MFGIGMPEMILILAIALIVIGPKKLPDLAKSLGRAMREFKKATNELKETMHIDSDLAEVKKSFNDFSEDVKDTVDLSLTPEKKKNDAAGKDGTADDKNTDKSAKAETEDFNNLKNAFDQLNANPNSSAAGETKPEESSSEAEDKKAKPKGSADDA